MDAKTMSEIIRVERATHPFTVMDNTPINDTGLSFDSLGVLVYLLSKPDNWQVKTKELQKRGGCGQSKMLRILKELEEEGYLARSKKAGEAGRFIWDIVIYENKYRNPKFGPRIKAIKESEPPDTHSSKREIITDFLTSENISLPETDEEWKLMAHPATMEWMLMARSFPGYDKLRFLVDQMGDKPDAYALATARTYWINSGYNPNNLMGIMEWYALIKHDPEWTPGAKYNKGKNNAGHSGNSGKFSEANRAAKSGPTEEHKEWFAAERARQATTPA